MSNEEQIALDHAWRHFELHAQQRVAVFNFFVASSGLLLGGLAYVLAGEVRLWPLGVVAGCGVAVLAFLFWKLDQRSKQLIAAGEAVIERAESASFPAELSVFGAAAAEPVNSAFWNVAPVWTFGRSFRVLFALVGLLGLVGAGTAAWRGAKSAPMKNAPTARFLKGTRAVSASGASASHAGPTASPVVGVPAGAHRRLDPLTSLTRRLSTTRGALPLLVRHAPGKGRADVRIYGHRNQPRSAFAISRDHRWPVPSPHPTEALRFLPIRDAPQNSAVT